MNYKKLPKRHAYFQFGHHFGLEEELDSQFDDEDKIKKAKRKKSKRYLGVLHSLNAKIDATINALKTLTDLILDIEIPFESKDVEKIINFYHQSAQLKKYAQELISYMFCFPQYHQMFFESGIFNDMITNFQDSTWLNGISSYILCGPEYRNKIIQTGVIQKIIEVITPKSNQKESIVSFDYELLSCVAIALVHFPINDPNECDIVIRLYSILRGIMTFLQIDGETAILNAICWLPLYNPQFVNILIDFDIISYFNSIGVIAHQNQCRIVSKFVQIMAKQFPDYIQHMIEHNVWNLIANFFEWSINAEMFRRQAYIIGSGAFIIASYDPRSFINSNVYVYFFRCFNFVTFRIRSLMSKIEYCVASKVTDQEFAMLMSSEEFRYILFTVEPEPLETDCLELFDAFTKTIIRITQLNEAESLLNELMENQNVNECIEIFRNSFEAGNWEKISKEQFDEIASDVEEKLSSLFVE